MTFYNLTFYLPPSSIGQEGGPEQIGISVAK